MPLIKSGSREAISSNISEMIKAGHPRNQAIAAALSTARRYGKKYADGGDVEPNEWESLPKSPEGRPQITIRPREPDTDPDEAQAAREAWALRHRRAVIPPEGRQEGLATALPEHMAEDILHLPERAFGAVQQYEETGEYNPKPILEGAMLPLGASAPFMEKNALGIAGAKAPLAKKPPVPVAPAAKEVEEAAAPIQEAVHGVIPSPSDYHLDSSNFWKIGEQKGSNPGGMYEDLATGERWYVKVPKTEDHRDNEILATRLYEMAGVPVPEIRPTTFNGKPALASKIVEGTVLNKAGETALTEYAGPWNYYDLKNNFPIDAWLANHDVIGTGKDNIIIDANNRAHRIDMGGALRYRAQGEPKKNFNNDVKELESMRDPNVNEDAADIFGTSNKSYEIRAAQRLDKITPEQIEAVIERWGPADSKERVDLYKNLLARKESIASHYLAEPAEAAASKAPEVAGKIADDDIRSTASAIVDHNFGDPDAIAGDLYSMALDDWKHADKVFRALPKDLQGPVNDFIYGIGNITGHNPFAAGMAAQQKAELATQEAYRHLTANELADISNEPYKQVPFTNIYEEIQALKAENGLYKTQQMAALLWDAAKLGDTAAALEAKESLPSTIKTAVNKQLHSMMGKLPLPKEQKTQIYNSLFKSKTQKAAQSNVVPFKPSETKNYKDAVAEWEAKQREADKVTADASKAVFPGEIENWTPRKAHQVFLQKAKPIDWVNWKPQDVLNVKKPQFGNITPKQAKELGFNPHVQFYHSSPEGMIEEFKDPLAYKGKHDEPAFFASHQSKIAAAYHGASFLHTLVGRAPKAFEINWKAYTGTYGYSGFKMKTLLDSARKEGADLVVITHMKDIGEDATQTQYAFINPVGTLRDVNAKFDPKKLHTGHRMAGLAGGGLFTYGTVKGQNGEDKMTRGGTPKYAAGGDASFFTHQSIREGSRSGMIHSPIPGRTDKIPMRVRGGSYVMPADVVSGLGQGNSTAGAVALNRLFKQGPYGANAGMKLPTPHVNYGRPMKTARPIRQRFAEGGEPEGDNGTDIIAAGGEYVIDPDTVRRLGGGDIKHGHDILDGLVLHLRKQTINDMKKLKPPKR